MSMEEGADMADELHNLSLSKNLSTKEIVAAVQKHCPKFDKTLLSKVKHAEEYGVTLKPDVLNKVIDQLVPDEKAAIKKRRDGHHRLTCRISCRLKDDDYSALQQAIKADGYNTMQNWLTDLVREYIKSKQPEFDHRRASAAQKEYCRVKGAPHFAPYHGICYRCGRDIYTEMEWPDGHRTGISVESAGAALITGCPHCNYSYCD